MPDLRLTPHPTERTTAITDALLAGLASAAALYFLKIRAVDPWKTGLWAWIFGLLGLAALLGAVAHGVENLPQTMHNIVWGLLYLVLGWVVALFAVGVTLDLWGPAAAQKLLLPMLVVGLLFFGVAALLSGKFIIFIVYQAAAMGFALTGYLWLTVTGQMAGAGWMVSGIVVTVVATTLQAGGKVKLKLIWQFDHNGVFHVLQMAGVVLLVIGLRASLLTN